MPGTRPSSAETVVEGAMLRALEKRFPGIINEICEDVEGTVSLTLVIRLREPSEAREVRAAFAGAADWLRKCETTAYASLGQPKARKKAKRA